MSLEMAHKVILPPKKNYIPQFLKQRDINSYSSFLPFTAANKINFDKSGYCIRSLLLLRRHLSLSSFTLLRQHMKRDQRQYGI
jgi:hypothetical protein